MNGYKLTWRERLADWISGGALARERREHARTNARLNAAHIQMMQANPALLSIYRATKDGKSGTAKMVARMAEEALK